MDFFKSICHYSPVVLRFLHVLSISSGFLMVGSGLSLLGFVVLGIFPWVWEIEILGVEVAPVIVAALSIYVTAKCTNIKSNYEKRMKV